MKDKKLAVVAIGGNALIKDNKRITLQDQMQAVQETCKNIADLVEAGWNVAITHGNGPQVGFLMRRVELAKGELPLIPLEILVADTQGGIGYMIQQSLINEFKRRNIQREAITVVTQVVVDKNDPAFQNPTKPVGAFLTKEQAEYYVKTEGWQVVEDAGRGWRRVVPSPEPKRIVEKTAICNLIERGIVVICAGGGGIPVIETVDGFEGVAAVIDKDYVSSLLAKDLKADILIVTTGVDKVSINFGKPNQQDLDTLTAAEASAYMAEGHFPPGSMGPKVTAILRFLENGEGEGIITSPVKLVHAIAGKTGTRIRN